MFLCTRCFCVLDNVRVWYFSKKVLLLRSARARGQSTLRSFLKNTLVLRIHFPVWRRVLQVFSSIAIVQAFSMIWRSGGAAFRRRWAIVSITIQYINYINSSHIHQRGAASWLPSIHAGVFLVLRSIALMTQNLFFSTGYHIASNYISFISFEINCSYNDLLFLTNHMYTWYLNIVILKDHGIKLNYNSTLCFDAYIPHDFP